MKNLVKWTIGALFIVFVQSAVLAAPADLRFLKNESTIEAVSKRIELCEWGDKIDKAHIKYIVSERAKCVLLTAPIIDGEGRLTGMVDFVCVPRYCEFNLEKSVNVVYGSENFEDNFILEISCRRGVSKIACKKELEKFMSAIGQTYYWHPVEHKLSKEPKEGYEEILINIITEEDYVPNADDELAEDET